MRCHHCEEQASCIQHVPIFASLNGEERLEIAQIASSRHYRKGEMVYRAGDASGTLFVLYTGKVKLFRINASGKEQVLRVVQPGKFIGELSLFSSLPLTDNAQALEDCIMCVVEGSKLKELMVKYPSIAFKVMDELARRLAEAENRIEIISLSSTTQRLAQALLALSGEGEEIILPMTKGDFASQLGMTQETLSRKLAALQEEGLLEQEGHRKIVIKNKSRLEELSLAE